MKRGVIILLVCSVVLGLCSCSLVTPSVKKCKENAKSLVTQDHRWHANITVKGGTQGGSDFAATGESDIDVVNGVARTHGYMRVSGSYMAMEEQFDVIQANGSSERYTLANRKGLWILDRLSRTFASDFQKLIDANKNTGRFTNRTVTFNEKSCYFLSYEVTSAEIIQDFFPCNTKKVIGKDYIDDIEKLSVMLYFSSDRAFEGATVKCSGNVAVSMTISKPTNAEEFQMPERTAVMEEAEDHPLIWNWEIYSPEGSGHLETPKKEPSGEDVKRSEQRGRNSMIVNIEGHDIEFPCLLSAFEDVGYTVKEPRNLEDSELCEFTLTRGNGDIIIATVFNEQTRAISYRDGLVISITVAAEENTDTAFVFPCGVQLMATEKNVQARYGSPFERVELDNAGNNVMCYYRVGTSMLAIVTYYYDMVDEVEIGPIEYYTDAYKE